MFKKAKHTRTQIYRFHQQRNHITRCLLQPSGHLWTDFDLVSVAAHSVPAPVPEKTGLSLSLSVTLRYTVVIQLSIYNIYTMYMPCILPCICHVYAMYMPCICHVYAMYMPCICHVYHMTHMTTQCTLGKSILSSITGITSGSLQWSSRLCQQR